MKWVIDNEKFINRPTLLLIMKTYKAPYFPVGWLEAFLKLIKRIRVEKIDSKWIISNNIGKAGNESRVVLGLKFLQLIDDEGNVNTEKMTSLKLEGDSYKTALQKIVKEAYSDLLSKVDVSKAYPTDILNYFITTYGYSKPPAQSASLLFLYLASQAGIELSEDLKRKNNTSLEKDSTQQTSIRRPRKTRTIQKSNESLSSEISPNLGAGEKIIISIRGKGLSFNQEINILEEVDGTLDVIKKLIEMNLKKDQKESNSALSGKP